MVETGHTRMRQKVKLWENIQKTWKTHQGPRDAENQTYISFGPIDPPEVIFYQLKFCEKNRLILNK